MPSDSEDFVNIVMDTFISVFDKQFNFPICIALVDSNGLTLHTIGQCPNLEFFEGILGSLITAFENLRTQTSKSFGDKPDSITVEFDKDHTYYVDDIKRTELYLVARTDTALIYKAQPFLKGIVKKIEDIIVLQTK